jgi:hypothetical protein
MLYKNWSGAVINARVRVPATSPVSVSAFGLSQNPLRLRPGAIGIIVNVLPENSVRWPSYVRFTGSFNLSYAAEVVIKKSQNSDVMWKDFKTVHMNDDETTVVLVRPVLDNLEIEYSSN